MSMSPRPEGARALPAAPRRPSPLYATVYMAFMAASGVPSPLYRLYQELWGFSPVVLTAIFAAYALSLFAALLTVGSLSDHIGRRPVVLASLALEAVALACFVGATGPGWLVAARLLQGFATGAATGALTAGIIDADPRRGALVNGVAPLLGMAAGTLATGALVDLAPAPLRLAFLLLLGVFALQAALVFAAAETAPRRPGAWASLRPRFHVPRGSRRDFARALPMSLAVWALGGFYLALMPSVVRQATGSQAALSGGAVITALMLSGAAASLAARGQPARRIIPAAALLLVAGLAATLAGVVSGSLPLLFAGTAVAGLGFGSGFLGTLKTALADVAPQDRAGLMSALYGVSYAAFSVPALAAGAAARAFGLVATALGFGLGVALMACAAAAASLAVSRVEPRVDKRSAIRH